MRMSRPVLLCLVGLVLLALSSQALMASGTVEQGWDLLITQPGTQFDFTTTPLSALGVVEFKGEPLQTFDFGGSIGVKNVYNVDTIIKRNETATDGGSGDDMIAIELVELSLKSVSPITVGSQPEDLFVRLNADFGDSTMTIHGLDSEGDPHGFFTSELHFTFDVEGSISGPLLTWEKTLNATADWRHKADPGAILIQLVNRNLNGSDNTGDFFPIAIVVEDEGGINLHLASTSPAPPVPTLSEIGLVVAGLLLMAGLLLVFRKRAARQPA